MGMPTLIGAGIGAIGAAATGNSPFKGALLGGSLGTGYGGVKSLIDGGSFMSGAFPFMAETVKPVSTSLIAQGGGATLPSYTAPIGMANTFDLATNAVTNPLNVAGITSEYAPAILSTAPSMGGLAAASTSVPMLQQLGYTWDEIKSMLPEMSSQNVSNVIGGANVARQYMQPRQTVQAPAGGVSRGNPPPANAVQELIAQMQAQQPRKRISLLVG